MLNILITSDSDEGYNLATRFKREGSIVRFYSTDKRKREWNKATPQIVEDWRPHISSADLILSLSSKIGGAVSAMDEGGRVWGWGLVEKALEGKKEIILKLVSSNPPIEEGLKFTLGCFFNNGLIKTPYIALHMSRFMEGDRGVKVNGMGCVASFIKEDMELLKLVKAVGEVLDGMNYVGLLEIDLVLQYNLYTVTNISCRSRNGLLQALSEQVKVPLGDFLYHQLSDTEAFSFRSNEVSVALGLSVPPWPFSSLKEENLWPIDDLRPAGKHLWLNYDNAFLGYITARGEDVNEARRRVYRTADNIVKEDLVQYRRDLGRGFEEVMKTLKEWNYIDRKEEKCSIAN